jgi:HD-like signal output (HDOD) protein
LRRHAADSRATLLEDLRETVAAGRLRLPVMPTVAAEVQEAVSRPGTSARVLSEIIETEPGMAARVVRIANSAMYAGLSEARTLSFAVARLGSAMVVSIVIGAAAKELFDCGDTRFETLMEEAWERSLLGAAAARQLRGLTEVPEDEAFLAGLLHSVGDPVLLDACATGEAGAPAAETTLTTGQLRGILDELRPEAGAALLRSWRLPADHVRAVAQQQPSSAGVSGTAGLDAIVATAARFAWSEVRRPGSGRENLVNHPAFRVLGGDEGDARECAELALEEFHELSRLL